MGNETCGLCGERIYYSDSRGWGKSRWRHVLLTDQDKCAWGHPSRPGVHLRSENLPGEENSQP